MARYAWSWKQAKKIRVNNNQALERGITKPWKQALEICMKYT